MVSASWPLSATGTTGLGRLGQVFGHDQVEAPAVRCPARCDPGSHRQAVAVHAEVDPGRETTFRAVRIFLRSPPFAPAACWWARITELSTICKASGTAPLSFGASSMIFHGPASVRRRNRQYTLDHFPNSSGRSRRGAPARAIHEMPSRRRRWLAGLRPLGLRTAARNGAQNAHSSSGTRLHAKMTSLAEGILNHASGPMGILLVNRAWILEPEAFQ